MINHQVYDSLCVFAVMGQLSASEKAAFDEHCRHCRSCLDRHQGMILLSCQLLQKAVTDTTPASMPVGALERFRARAIREGIALRADPAASFPTYRLGLAIVALIVMVMLTWLPPAREARNIAQLPAASLGANPKHVSTVYKPQNPTPRLSRISLEHPARRSVTSHINHEVNTASVTSQRFPQLIIAGYSLFEPQSAPKLPPTSYSTISQSQIQRLDLFPTFDDTSKRMVVGIAALDHPIAIASTGNVVDFAAHIRQLHFQLATVQ